MFNTVHDLLSAPPDQPTFTLAFSVSNHSPWEYPSGRIVPDGNPATVDNTVRYADWAIAQFFDQAKKSDYWDNTVFLIVADHDSRVAGSSLLPLRHIHIHALITLADAAALPHARPTRQINLPTNYPST